MNEVDYASALAGIESDVKYISAAVDEIKESLSGHSARIHELELGNERQKHANTSMRDTIAENRGILKAMTPASVREGQYAVAVLKWIVVIAATTALNQLPNIIRLLGM